MATETRTRTFRPFDKQRDFWQDTSREILLSSGWGGGKSRILLEKLDAFARTYPGTKCLIARKVNADLPGSTLAQYFEQVLPENHIVDGPHKQEQWVRVRTHGAPSTVYWGGLDRRRKFGSTEFGYIAVDEASELDREDWIWLRGRLRIPGVGYHQLAGATNPPPEGKEHWMYAYFIESDRPVIYCPPTANPHLDPAYLHDLQQLDGILYQRYVEGEWVGAKGTWLTRDMLTPVHAEAIAGRDLRWIVAVDLGLEPDPQRAEEKDTDYWAAVIIGYDHANRVAYLVDCARQRGMDKATAVTWLGHILDQVPVNTAYIESVHAQRYFVQECREHGIQVKPVEQSRGKRQRLAFLSIPFSQERVKLVNHKRIPEDGLESRWDAFVSEWVSFPGRHDDLLDAAEMGLRQLDLGVSIKAYGGHAFGDR